MVLRSILTSMPIYQLFLQDIPTSSKKSLNKILKDFFWKGSHPKKKFNLMAWDKMYQPKQAQGLGICNIRLKALALGKKLIWKMIRKRELSCLRALSNKYLNALDPLSILRTKSPPLYIIFNKVTWKVVNGKEVRFWIDS